MKTLAFKKPRGFVLKAASEFYAKFIPGSGMAAAAVDRLTLAWTASHILFRGAAVADALPTAEPRVLHGFSDAYGIVSPSIETFQRMAESWRPLRMWVCILLARHLARVGGWNRPQLVRERAAAARQLRAELR